ncbi:MAG TPA: hypothetical protein VFR73_19175 [Hyphomicrobiaceae bacterium]|nr:hypothetical protein [Hyphomicrobiaceae bacterium]
MVVLLGSCGIAIERFAVQLLVITLALPATIRSTSIASARFGSPTHAKLRLSDDLSGALTVPEPCAAIGAPVAH